MFEDDPKVEYELEDTVRINVHSRTGVVHVWYILVWIEHSELFAECLALCVITSMASYLRNN